MAVTDHCEVNRYFEKARYKIDYEQKYDEYGFKKSFENSMAEISSAKELYSGKVNLICGVELGQPISDIETAENILSDTRLTLL